MKCTWMGKNDERCDAEATYPQIGKDGEQWASLCTKHHEQVEAAITDFDPRKLLGNWVRAQGGAKAAARRMMGEPRRISGSSE